MGAAASWWRPPPCLRRRGADVAKLAQTAKSLHGYLIEVEGFADSSGSAAVNQQLSQERSLVLDLIRPHRWMLAIVLLAMVVETLMSLAAPWPLKVVLDNVVGGSPCSCRTPSSSGLQPLTPSQGRSDLQSVV